MRCLVTVRVPSWGQNHHPWHADLDASQVAWLREQYGDRAVHALDPVADAAPEAEPVADEPEPAPKAKRSRR